MIWFPDLTGRGKNNFSLVVSASISDSDVHGVKTRAEPVIQLHDDLDLTHRFLEIVSFFYFIPWGQNTGEVLWFTIAVAECLKIYSKPIKVAEAETWFYEAWQTLEHATAYKRRTYYPLVCEVPFWSHFSVTFLAFGNQTSDTRVLCSGAYMVNIYCLA